MLVTIQPSALTGEILAPASKSSMQRACAAALLRAGETIIHHPGYSNDDKAALGVIRDLGAEVSAQADGSLRVVSKGVGHGATGRERLETVGGGEIAARADWGFGCLRPLSP
jgi:5-enolpyruvylshikimate-3-phosphate synthase